MSPVFVSLHIWKSTKILHGDDCFDQQKLHETRRNILEKHVLDCMYSPFTEVILYSDLPCLFGAVSQSCLSCISWAAVLILPQIKLNSQLSSCTFVCVCVNKEEEKQGLYCLCEH